MRILHSIALLLLSITAAGVFAQSEGEPGTFDDLLLAARQAQGKNDYAAAAGYYRQAVKLRADIPELWANLGLMEDATGTYADAVASFQKAEQLKPSLYVPNLFLGIDYLHLNRAHDAIIFLLKAEALNSSDPQAPVSLGRAYLSQGDFDAARSAFQRAVALDTKDSSAWYSLGIAAIKEVEANGRKLSTSGAYSAYTHALFAESLQEQSRFKQATTETQAALAADSHFLCVHAMLGLLYLAQEQKDDAVREFDTEAPGCPLVGLGRARLHLEADEDSAALALLMELWKNDSGFVRTHLALLVSGLDATHKNTFAEFVDLKSGAGAIPADLAAPLSAALREAPQPVKEYVSAKSSEDGEPGTTPNIAAAEADARAGRYARCAEELSRGTRELSRSTPRGNGNGFLLLARCAFMTGDYPLAARSSKLAAAESTNEMAALYWSVKANEKIAFIAFSHFEELEPDSPKTHLLLGDIYRQRQQMEDAENEYKAAARLAPNNPAPLYGLASAYAQDSKPELALSTVEIALERSPDDPDINLLAGEILVEQQKWEQAEEYLKRSLSVSHPLKPQMLPHVHVLLGKVYAQTDRLQEAVREFRMGLSSDDDGTVYYQLARVYIRLGNKEAAEDALAHSKDLEQKRRERAVVALQDSGTAAADIP
jgi:tetratricopeptide (TPR) repeat protein